MCRMIIKYAEENLQLPWRTQMVLLPKLRLDCLHICLQQPEYHIQQAHCLHHAKQDTNKRMTLRSREAKNAWKTLDLEHLSWLTR